MLEEAVKMCEEALSKKSGGAVDNLSRFGGIDDAGYTPYFYATWDEYFQKQGICLEGILQELKLLGLSGENIERLKGTSLLHAYYVLNKLENDVVPTHEELVKAVKLYSKLELLSQRDMWWVLQKEPSVVALTTCNSSSKVKTLSVDCANFDELTQTDQKELQAEITKAVNSIIQAFMEKTKSKRISPKSSS